jgi:hypothetical protein
VTRANGVAGPGRIRAAVAACGSADGASGYRHDMAGTPIHTVPTDDDGWAVEREGSDRPVSTHRTKAEAEEAGRQLARQDAVEHIIHERDGTIGERNSYGSDPASRPG